MTTVSMVRIASSKDTLSATLLDAIVSHVQKQNKESSFCSEIKMDPSGLGLAWTISNKYFDAPVQLEEFVPSKKDEISTHSSQDGIILLFDGHLDGKEQFDALAALHAQAEHDQVGDLLRLCLSISNLDTTTTGSTANTERDEAEYSRRILWCLDRGYEYVDAVDLSEEGRLLGHEERDKEGFARVMEAIQGTVWSSAVMHSKTKTKLRTDYENSKTTILQDSSNSAEDAKENAEEAKENPYIPPDDFLLQQQGQLEQETERQDRMDQLLPKNAPNDGMTTEERRQDQMFQQMDGALQQAKQIREMSRNGQLSDDERRQRAGDAAMLIATLMDSMMGEDDESDQDEEEDDNQE